MICINYLLYGDADILFFLQHCHIKKKALPVFCKESSISKHDLHCHLKDRKFIMKLQFKYTVQAIIPADIHLHLRFIDHYKISS